MSRIVLQESRCKGCLLCTTVCPEELLRQSQRLNASGFRVVEQIQENGCTGCAFCAEICPDYAITVYKSRKKGSKEPST